MNIKTVIPVLSEKKEAEKKDPEKMDLIMRTVKAVHSATTSETFSSIEELNKQRVEIERFSKLVAPSGQVSIKDFEVDGMACELVTPTPHRGGKVIMYCHGGGYTCGGLGYARILAAKMAIHTGLEVVTFEYRLAPEHPYPAAIEDGMKLWNYLMHKGYGAGDIILSGDSAGGNLALEMCIRLKGEGRFLPKALVLYSPWTDMRAILPSYKNYADKDPMLTYNYVASVRNAYAGSDANYELPEYSPVLADLTGFPPTLVQVGSNEILRSDSELLAKNMIKAGTFAKLEVYQGGFHVFQQLPLPRATHAIENAAQFIDTMLK